MFYYVLLIFFNKYVWVFPLKEKKLLVLLRLKKLDESSGKPNTIRVDKGSEFYNISTKPWLKNNNIEIYSTHNEGKSGVAERFIRTLNNIIYKYMTLISRKLILINYMI